MPSLISRPARQRPIPQPTIYSAHVRDCYMFERSFKTGDHEYSAYHNPRWDGGIDSQGTRWTTDHWSRLAATVMDIGVPPDEYLAFQFSRCARVPLPDELVRSDARSTYPRSRLPGQREQLRLRLAYEQNTLRVKSFHLERGLGWDHPRAVRQVVGSTDTVKLSPLFRYSVSCFYNFEDLIEYFYEAALLQYVFQQPAYDEVWGCLLPQDLRETAQKDRADHLAAHGEV